MTSRAKLALRTLCGSWLALWLTACPPDLNGEKCQDDCSCPTQQICAVDASGAGHRQPGPNRCLGDGGLDAGGQGLLGTVTLNGGATKPAANALWVMAWETNPPDGGAPPKFTVTTNSAGIFAFPQAVANRNYYLLAQYDLDNDGNPQDPGHQDKYQSAGPVQIAQNPIQIDLQTSSCTLFANHLTGGLGPMLWEAVAAVPDVQTGLELTSGVTVSVAGAQLGTQTLQFQGTTRDPLSSGLWAYIPAELTRPAAESAYTFNVSGNFYNNAVCSVTRQGLNAFPTSVDISVDGGLGGTIWEIDPNLTDLVQWDPAQGSDYSLVDLRGPQLTTGLRGTDFANAQSGPGGTSLAFPGETLPKTACDSAGVIHCVCSITSILETVAGNATSLDGATTDLQFQTTVR